MSEEVFLKRYKALNKAQKEAVDAIEGPVMVIAGPGTGKTQVLTLRIANILKRTDTPADGILCLTFTNSGVRAMRQRLLELAGPEASRVQISTFHSFGTKLIEEFYEVLDLPAPPKHLDDRDAVLLFDKLLEVNEWEYLRTRGGGAHSYRDLRLLFSFLKREGIDANEFIGMVEADIKETKDKARLKSLGRTREAAKFFELYESVKAKENLVDYDDILRYLVDIVKSSRDARDTIRERYLYVLVDEHQDSSGVQNEFLESVWSKVEKPNIFVVGDDRQLIYGFGGASLDHFKSFRESFSGGRLISLTDNYRSTQNILDIADDVLKSSIVKEGLKGAKDGEPIRLVEASYPRDEILAAGLDIKYSGVDLSECAVLVPKNAQVKSAVAVLKDLGLPVAAGDKVSFFGLPETEFLLSVLRLLADPLNAAKLAKLVINPRLGLDTLSAHKLIRKHGNKLSIDDLPEGSLHELIALSNNKNVYEIIQEVSRSFFYKSKDHEALLREIEVARTFLHLALARIERDPKEDLQGFVAFTDRLEEYGENIPLSIFSADEGIRVMTLHGSKGLEFDYVWIAHMNEKSLMGGKRAGFVLPEKLMQFAAKKDELTARRELFVAMTRAKKRLTLSYARKTYTGADEELAKIAAEIPENRLEKIDASKTESVILESDPKIYVENRKVGEPDVQVQIKKLVDSHIDHMSIAVTHLNNFFSCPWKWYFRNFLRLPEPESEYLVFGDKLHKLISEVIKTRSVDLGADYEKDVIKALDKFVDKILPDISEDSKSEISLRTVREGFELTGKLDLVEQMEDGSVRVTDFKTGSVKTKGVIEKRDTEGRMSEYLRQLATYDFLLRNTKKVSGEITSRLVFLEAPEGDKNFIYETNIGKEETNLLIKDVEDFHTLLKSGLWMERKCENDSYGRPCEYCAMKNLLL